MTEGDEYIRHNNVPCLAHKLRIVAVIINHVATLRSNVHVRAAMREMGGGWWVLDGRNERELIMESFLRERV